MKFQRLLAASFSILFVLSCFSCSKDSGENPTVQSDNTASDLSSVGSSTETEVPVETEPAFIDNLPDNIDLNGYNVRVLGNKGGFELTVDDSAEVINDLVYRRNLAIEERFDCKISSVSFSGNAWEVFNDIVTNAVTAGSDDFDGLVDYVYQKYSN